MPKNKINKVLKTISYKRSDCPVSCTLDLIGDKWTLLIIRDLLLGKSRFKDFSESAEGIPTNILANRLQKLEKTGLVRKIPYQKHPPRYEYCLTETGMDLVPVIKAIINWAEKHLPGVRLPNQV